MDHFMLLVATALIFSIVAFYQIVIRGSKKGGAAGGQLPKKCHGCGREFYGTPGVCPYCGEEQTGKFGGFLPIAALAVAFILLIIYFQRTWAGMS